MYTYEWAEDILLRMIHGQRFDGISVFDINKIVKEMLHNGSITKMQYTRLWTLMKDIHYEEGWGSK